VTNNPDYLSNGDIINDLERIAVLAYPVHSSPPGSCQAIAKPFSMGKLEWWGYPTVKISLVICLAVLAQSTRVTDG